MKKLSDILHNVKIEQIINKRDLFVGGLAFDSRKTEKDFVFVAEKGEQTDGHLFIEKAISNGAKVIVFEQEDKISDFKESITYLKVKSSSLALGIMASNYYDNPTKKLKLVGITGTNGKTTTATLLYRLFSSMGKSCGLISTIENRINEKIIPTERTTPDALTLN